MLLPKFFIKKYAILMPNELFVIVLEIDRTANKSHGTEFEKPEKPIFISIVWVNAATLTITNIHTIGWHASRITPAIAVKNKINIRVAWGESVVKFGRIKQAAVATIPNIEIFLKFILLGGFKNFMAK